jgi:hypothetical protein
MVHKIPAASKHKKRKFPRPVTENKIAGEIKTFGKSSEW